MSSIEFSTEEKEVIGLKIQLYFSEELDQQIGQFDAGQNRYDSQADWFMNDSVDISHQKHTHRLESARSRSRVRVS